MSLINAGITLIKPSLLRRLFESMPGRVKAVLKSKGVRSRHTKY